ncbi:MAG TPA: site-specific DNA-methyltransferase [Leptospiraceae bacterium]|nr:site-specific DNA-methyltransferase [Leptospiraceae bacterium]HNN77093.1 site-specific DNA-methyltransferase [Leptospiraceae bacterium]
MQAINSLPVHSGELWTARQRQMHPIHYTISYRGSFKPELPDFFINRYLKVPGVVLDPFGGRGTTTLQANLLGHRAVHNDLNPVSVFLARSRQNVPAMKILEKRLDALQLDRRMKPTPEEKERLSPFFHPRTLSEILCLKSELLDNMEDPAMRYIGVTALSRLHGHSDGFFSVYSFPQISIMPGAQRKNNARLGQKPEYRSIRERILRKMKRDLSLPLPGVFNEAARGNRYISENSQDLKTVRTSSVDLIVTSPPFLDKVDYISDNWMRSWFLGLESVTSSIELSVMNSLSEWEDFMRATLFEMGRVLRPGARAVVEVGEVKSRSVLLNLEQVLAGLLPIRVPGGELAVEEILINEQKFTKLSNCWDVKNNEKGTNTNRCLIVRKNLRKA